MIPKVKIDEPLYPRPDPEFGVISGDAQAPDGAPTRKKQDIDQRHTTPVQILGSRSRLSWLFLSNLLHRHSLVVLVLVILCLAIGVYGTSKLKNHYTATALLVLDQSSTRLLGPENPPPLNPDGEAELLKSESIALRVIDQLELTTDPEYNPKSERPSQFVAEIKRVIATLLQDLGLTGLEPQAEPSSVQSAAGVQPLPPEKAAALQLLKQNITIRRRGLTDLLAVEAKAANPHRAARIANAYAQAYLDEQIAIKAQTLRKAENILSRQLAELNEELKRSEAQIGLRQSYQEILVRLRGIAQKRETLSADARIVSPARPPGGPAFPSARLLGVAGIVFSAAAGLGLALALAVYREIGLHRAYKESDVTAASGVANLAVIPRANTIFKWGRAKQRHREENSEAIRKLFFTLPLTDQKGGKLSSWLITSSRHCEGKTDLGLSLARVAAATGQKAVVIDCDLKRPRLHQTLGLNNDRGLADLLLGRSDVQGVVQEDASSDCKFIAAGLPDDGAIEKHLRPDRLRNVARKLRLEYDFIIFLTPPLKTSADSLIYMSIVDAALITVRLGETVAGELSSSIQQLQRCNGNNVYTVIVDAPPEI